MNDIFHDMSDICVMVYLDDVLIFSSSMAEHHVHVHQVLQHLHDHYLHVKPEKCQFHTDTMSTLVSLFLLMVSLWTPPRVVLFMIGQFHDL